MQTPNLISHAPAAPEYLKTLSVLQDILDFQARLAERIQPSLHLDRDTARNKWRAETPLFASENLTFSPVLFAEACQELHDLLPAGSRSQITCDRLLASSFLDEDNLQSFLDDLRNDREATIQRLTGAVATDERTLHATLRVVLSPFYAREAAPYQDWLDPTLWRRGFCPICGSTPGMARLAYDEGGRRYLACSLCRSEWAFDRLRCPFCEQPGPPRTRYFTLGDDEVHRVECCDHCRSYLKTVDERILGRRANLLVEDMITAHLDDAAREQGYH
jgi:formate dehydrogenase maturation protein FdhE